VIESEIALPYFTDIRVAGLRGILKKVISYRLLVIGYPLLVISVVALGLDNKKRPRATTLITNNG
jgi:hypothetical protein